MTTGEVTAADIARLAGVGRAAVSNWRRRYSDFPQPVGGPATSPTFALAEVEAWLRANGRPVDDQSPGHGEANARPASEAQSGLVRVIAGLVPPLRKGLVVDPACGPGRLLAAVAARLGPSVRYAGQDPHPADVTAAAKVVAGAGATSADVKVGSPFDADALAQYRGGADLVVCLPPGRSWQPTETSLDQSWEFGPPHPLDPRLAWMQICYSYVKPGGRLIIPMPYATAVRAPGRRIRAEMLRAGALEQVIALPERLAGGVTGPRQIWVLTRPSGRPTYSVRLVDLTDAEPGDVPTNANGWEGVYADEALTRDIESIELLDEDVLLVPARHIEVPVRDVTEEYARLRTALTKAAGALDVGLPAFRPHTEPARLPTTTITDLVRAGALTFVDKDAELRPGDIAVPGGGYRFDATVVTDPPPVREDVGGADVLRCDENALDPHFVACFLRSDLNRRQAAGTQGGTFRLDLRRARVPRLPLTEQRRYGDAFRRLTAVTDQIDDLAALATDALRSAVYGLTSGTFLPEDAP